MLALDAYTVSYVYPRTGSPDRPVPDGWDAIPGARGCTPQSCAFRDHGAEFYPVFPPDRNAADVVAWLRARA